MTDTEKLDLLLQKVTDISTDVGQLKDEMAALKTDLLDWKYTFENENRRNMNSIAEERIRSSQNMSEVMKLQGEVVLLTVRTNALVSDVREIKRSIS